MFNDFFNYAVTLFWSDDSISFAEEFDSDIVVQDGVLDDIYLKESIYLWKYPGSEECYAMGPEEYLPSYDKLYVDEKEHSWGHVGYYFGMKNVWVCIDQPTADFQMLYPDGAPQRGLANADRGEQISTESESALSTIEETKRIVPKQNTSMVILTVVLVLMVVLVTTGLLMKLKQKE